MTALLLFGTNGFAASHIHLASGDIVFWRTLIGSAGLLLLFVLTKNRFSFGERPREVCCIGLSGVAMGLSWLLLYEAYALVGVSVASLLYYCGPVIVMALSPILFQERLTAVKLSGFAAVLAGIFLVNGQAVEQLNSRGIICGCLSAVLYAVMVLANKKAQHITGLANALLQLGAGFLTTAVFVGVKNGGYSMPNTLEDWVWVMLLGVLNTGIGCYLYFSSIGKLPVQSVAVCGYLEPLAAVVFSVGFLKETLLPWQAVGAALIIGGALLGECFGKSSTESQEPCTLRSKGLHR